MFQVYNACLICRVLCTKSHVLRQTTLPAGAHSIQEVLTQHNALATSHQCGSKLSLTNCSPQAVASTAIPSNAQKLQITLTSIDRFNCSTDNRVAVIKTALFLIVLQSCSHARTHACTHACSTYMIHTWYTYIHTRMHTRTLAHTHTRTPTHPHNCVYLGDVWGTRRRFAKLLFNKIDKMDSRIGLEMSLRVVKAIRGRCASFMILTARVSEIFGGQTNSSISVL